MFSKKSKIQLPVCASCVETTKQTHETRHWRCLVDKIIMNGTWSTVRVSPSSCFNFQEKNQIYRNKLTQNILG